MRRRLAWVFVALAVMLTVGFLVPLGLSVRSQAELRGLAGAQSDARGVATALAAVAGSTGEVPGPAEAEFILATYGAADLLIALPDGTTIGSSAVDTTALPLAETGSIVADVEGGAVAVVPVAFADAIDPIVVTSFVSDDKLREGVATSWLILAALGLIVVVGAVPLADRLAGSLTRPVRDLSAAAHRWAGGDLTARVSPEGPPEIVESGRAFNLLAERLTDLLAAERERVADLSHRLRTPLAALRLQAESTQDSDHRAALVADISNLEGEVTALIEDVRRRDVEGAAVADLSLVVAQRMGFWQVVAAAQDRELSLKSPERGPVPVAAPDSDVLTVLDNLVQNVLTHTTPGTEFTVAVDTNPPSLTVADLGEGLPSADVFDRGSTTRESSGLGLDIVRRIAEASGGDVRIGDGPGATIIVRFGTPPDSKS
ncbi:MAG: HAMP domain-containing sensor histidine kinase [Actinomycetota bacterium]|nr:HAMP domain-containing sensor histidine kinase [Actinomycetota bacterium]